MKRSPIGAVFALGGAAAIGLASWYLLVAPAGAQQQPAQQQPAQQQQAAPPAQQGASNQSLGLRQGQDPFAAQAQQQSAPAQQPLQNPFAVPARNSFAPTQSQQAAQPPAMQQQAAPQQAVQNPFAVQPANRPAASPGQQSNPGCEKLVTLLTSRREMMGKINETAKEKKKLDAQMACGLFTKLSANGNETVKWMNTNKDWCGVPDQLIANLKTDNEKVSNFRGQACKAAAQIEEMKKNGGQPGQGGLLGGNGLSGEMKIPSGAL
jgi:hypothetical protein